VSNTVGCRIKSERRGTPASVECRGGESKGGRRKMIRRSGRDDDDDLGMCDGEEKKGRQWPRETLSMKSGNWGVDARPQSVSSQVLVEFRAF
jgi:hypothetical protein